MSSVTAPTPPPSRWPIIALVLSIFCLAGLEAGIVMRARAALIDPRTADEAQTTLVESMLPPAEMAFDLRPAPRLVPDADVLIAHMLGPPAPTPFDFRPAPHLDRPDPGRLIAAMLGPPDSGFDFRPGPRLVNLDPGGLISDVLGPADLAFDWRPPPRLERPEPAALILAMLPPAPTPFDFRPAPRLEHVDPVDLMVALLPPIGAMLDIRPLPALPDPPPALAEPHMQVEEAWVGRWRKRNPDPMQRVHFAGNVVSRCLPRTLLKVLADIGERFGEVKVISGYRSPSHNRRVGGATRSMHLECRAIDFYVAGRNAGLLQYLAGRRDVGGYARYPFGSYHIDNGPRRNW